MNVVHSIYGSFELSRAIASVQEDNLGGINLSSYHEDHEDFPCTAEIEEWVVPELGERAFSTLQDEALGFGALFDLEYAHYLETQGIA